MSLFLSIATMITTIVAVFVITIVLVGRSQPSVPFMENGPVLFVAAKATEETFALELDADTDILWQSETAFTVVGVQDPYWTHFAIMRRPEDAQTPLFLNGNFQDLYVVQVEPTKIPKAFLGFLRIQRLLGLSKTPTGPLPTDTSDIGGRREIIPNDHNLGQIYDAPLGEPRAMVNFLKYFERIETDGKAEAGRKAYQRYGLRAIRAVHQVGGQLIFSGRIKRVLINAKSGPTTGTWDDIAIMRYPEARALITMEQLPYYREGLEDRERGLDETMVIATTPKPVKP